MIRDLINLETLANANDAEVSTMVAELKGDNGPASSGLEARWPLRFIAAGEKTLLKS